MSESFREKFKSYLKDWSEGVELFNQGQYWHAHEAWERGWTRLEPLPRLHVQAMIQIAGVICLLEKQRWGAAAALSSLALEKIERLERAEPPTPLSIPGAPSFLREVQAMVEGPSRGWREQAQGLRAVLDLPQTL